jgi:N-methylhydantoinase A/oxoprolinase/acetone carboxylase beta subunit
VKRLGVGVGGTFTDLVLYDAESGPLAADRWRARRPDPTAQGIARRAPLSAPVAPGRGRLIAAVPQDFG